MERGVPFYTLDPATGEMIAMFDDGTVTPVPSGGGSHAIHGTARGTGTGPQPSPIQPISGGAGLSRAGGARGLRTDGGDVPHYAGLTTDPIPTPGNYGDSGGGGGGGIDVRARLAAARSRLSGAFGGGYSGGGSGGYDSDIPRPRPDRLHGRYAKGLDPAQAAGLTMQPTAMLPEVFPGLTPADPLYGNLAELPVGAWSMILGNGTPQSIANTTGRIYERAGERGALPSTDRLLRQLQQGGGIEDAFQGVKAGPNDYESYLQPGYVSGQEPMPMGEAAYTYSGLLDAALSQEPLLTAQKYGSEPSAWGGWMISKWANRAMKRPPGKTTPVYRAVGRKLFR